MSTITSQFLELPHGRLDLPTFLPDATRGVVRSVDSTDLERCGVTALVMNTFHLMQSPGSSTIQSAGGLHDFTGWNKPILTDSGGFQIYSLIRESPKRGSIRDKGATFDLEGMDRKVNLTPEKSIQLQLSYHSDIVVCLDDCTHVDASLEVQKESVRRTIAWAKRCKSEFERLVTSKRISHPRPLLFGVIQGGGSLELRRWCAEELTEIGFDGFGFGGWPLDAEGNLLSDILQYTRNLIPTAVPLHALGVGHPVSVRDCYLMGYQMYDSALPTRDARRGRLYRLNHNSIHFGSDWFSFLYIEDKKHIKANSPIFDECDCSTCRTYSLSYLHHLYKIQDGLFERLATIHNLRFMARMMEMLVQNG